MTLQTLTIGNRQFVLIQKREFQKLAELAQRQTEDDFWTRAAMVAEREAKLKKEKPIPFELVERELDARKRSRRGRSRNAK